jgi:hypothetical protein
VFIPPLVAKEGGEMHKNSVKKMKNRSLSNTHCKGDFLQGKRETHSDRTFLLLKVNDTSLFFCFTRVKDTFTHVETINTLYERKREREDASRRSLIEEQLRGRKENCYASCQRHTADEDFCRFAPLFNPEGSSFLLERYASEGNNRKNMTRETELVCLE